MNVGLRRSVLGLALLTVMSIGQAQPVGDEGYGPGMAYRHAPDMRYGYGPGMMGWGGGAGMMQGGGGPGMAYGGPGMMGYGGPYGGAGMGRFLQRRLDLSDEQRKKIDAIDDELAKARWDVMGRMNGEMRTMRELMQAEPRDRAAIEASFKRMSDLRQQHFSLMLSAEERIDGVLAPDQRAKLHRAMRSWDDE